jgi:3,4-dihydroxy 2-butanone 4-phosphate synthase/GTP cyclohydrolase II
MSVRKVHYTSSSGNGGDLHFLSTTEEIIEDLRNGRMIVLVDAEDKENEGDLVIPAQMATPDAINFMAKYGRGLICLSLTEQRAAQLRLEYMSRHHEAKNRTAFTVSIEAKEGVTTGISAHDRARTIATAIDPTKDHRDIVTPGHVFPLIAREGGALVRAGHTEASVDLTRLAGLYPAAVICEIMNDDGTMARIPDLVPFAQRHGLKIGTIEDLIAYRIRHDKVVKLLAENKKATSLFGGEWRVRVYGTSSADPSEHIALVKGDIETGGPVLVRVHALNVWQDVLGMAASEARRGLVQRAMEMVAREGRGVIVLIRNSRPGITSEMVKRATGEKPGGFVDNRLLELGIGSQILHDLGVHDMVVLSNSPSARYVGIEGYGLRVVGTRQIE